MLIFNHLGATEYELRATSSDMSEEIVVYSLIGLHYRLENLTAGTDYDVTIVAVGQQEGRMSEPSSVQSVSTSKTVTNLLFEHVVSV